MPSGSIIPRAALTDLVNHSERNDLIVRDTLKAVHRGRKSLVLTDRVGHANVLAEMLADAGVSVVALHGQKSKQEREAVRELVDRGQVSVVVATGQLIGEGWDCPRLDTLFLATPISWHGRLKQYLGRVSRSAPGKRDAIVIDYTDDCAMMWSQWKKRRDVYDSLDYSWYSYDPMYADWAA